jgi:hypothetical protein
MHPRPPASLPPFTFLMSDHTTHKLACEVAALLVAESDLVYIDDFLAPIQNGLSALLDVDWKRDLGDFTTTNRLVLEAKVESTERDLIVSLEKWFNETFGDDRLGKLALKRALDHREMYEYSYVFRDATRVHVKPFIDRIKPRDMMIVYLTPSMDAARVVDGIMKEQAL